MTTGVLFRLYFTCVVVLRLRYIVVPSKFTLFDFVLRIMGSREIKFDSICVENRECRLNTYAKLELCGFIFVTTNGRSLI